MFDAFKAKKKTQTTLGINKPSSLASVVCLCALILVESALFNVTQGPFKRSISGPASHDALKKPRMSSPPVQAAASVDPPSSPAPTSPTESAVPNATFNPSGAQPKRAPMKTLRETYAPYIAARFPQFPIRNDFDRLELGPGAQTYEDLVGNDEIRARLDEQWKIFVALNGGDADSAMLRITRWLDSLTEITGVSITRYLSVLLCSCQNAILSPSQFRATMSPSCLFRTRNIASDYGLHRLCAESTALTLLTRSISFNRSALRRASSSTLISRWFHRGFACVLTAYTR